MRNKATSHRKTLSLPDTSRVTDIPIIKIPEKHVTVPPAEGNDAECGKE